MVSKQWTGKVVKGSDHGIILCPLLEFAWSPKGKPQHPSVKVVGLRAKIWTRNFSNSCYRLRLLSYWLCLVGLSAVTFP
jgi:hypothetical protein